MYSSSVPPDSDAGDTARAVGDILVVDDNPSNLLAIQTALENTGCRVVKAHSGPEALRCLLRQDFALILLDVQMPTMDGFQTARLIRERKRSRATPIIFVTAYGREEGEVMQAYALGAVDFLFKPIVPDVLRAKAAVFLELERRTPEVARQSALLREHERRQHQAALEEERRRWEAEVLRRQMEEERRIAAETARKADELARTVAEKERVQQQLTLSNQQLAEADRRKDEFLAVLAHELRNPLAPIVTSLELLRLRLPTEDHSVARVRDTMDRQVMHLSRLVDDLLDVSRISSGKIELRKENTELSEIIRQAVNTSQPLITKRKQELEVSLSETPIFMDADSVRLTQVVSNLLNNASRYTDIGGKLRLLVERDAGDVCIRVCDNGRGIPSELLPKIFEMFVQENKGGGGLGLGLTLVKRLVELHNGSVEAKSDGAGKGSEFIVRLSITHQIEDGKASSVEDLEPMTRLLNVVLVEDNPDIRETVSQLLRVWGHTVELAGDGESGIRAIVEQAPDVALVDIGLPECDGYVVARSVREQLGSDVRLVAMTGYGQAEDRRRAEEAGFDAHLIKPATAESLRKVLEGAEGGWELKLSPALPQRSNGGADGVARKGR